MLHSINWPNFIIWLPLLFKTLGNMCIKIVCQSGCDVIKFEINLIFSIISFRYMTKKSRQKFKYLEKEKSFWGEIKNFFIILKRAFSCQKVSQTCECTFKILLNCLFNNNTKEMSMDVFKKIKDYQSFQKI